MVKTNEVKLTDEQKLELALNKALRGNVSEDILKEAKQADTWTTTSKVLLLSFDPWAQEEELDEDGTVVVTATFKSSKDGVEVEVEEISACLLNKSWTFSIHNEEDDDGNNILTKYVNVSYSFWNIHSGQWSKESYTTDYDLSDYDLYNEDDQKAITDELLCDVVDQIRIDEESREQYSQDY